MKLSETKQETRTLGTLVLSESDPCGSRSEKWLIMVLFSTLSDKLLRSVAADLIEKEFLEMPVRHL